MSVIRCREGAFEPGFRRRQERGRHFRSANAVWNLNSLAGAMLAESFGMATSEYEEADYSEHKAVERLL
jgi:hypothetical protein